MARPATPAFDSKHDLVEPPQLYRSEGFAEDLPDWDDSPAAPADGPVHSMAAWLMGAPLALALVGTVSSLAVWV
jgi:hypothetical protein